MRHCCCGLILLAVSPALAPAQAPASRVMADLGERAAPGPSQPTSAPTSFVCKSNIGGTVPQFGPVFHSSIAICSSGQQPTIAQSGTSVNNRNCNFYGTQPGTSTFQRELSRVDVHCKPTQASAASVEQCVSTYHKSYNFFTNNCQHAANSCQFASGLPANNGRFAPGPAASGRTNGCANVLASQGTGKSIGQSPAAGTGGKGSTTGGTSGKGSTTGGKGNTTGGKR
jgi:hypothetical protein